jgi:hypothetical protein
MSRGRHRVSSFSRRYRLRTAHPLSTKPAFRTNSRRPLQIPAVVGLRVRWLGDWHCAYIIAGEVRALSPRTASNTQRDNDAVAREVTKRL